VRVFIPFFLVLSCANAQSALADRLTFSGGYTQQFGGYSYVPKEAATGFGLSYGHRFRRYVEAEAGVFTTNNPTGDICASYGCTDVGDRYWWVPFGVRLIAPLYLGRVEFAGGGGGLYENYTVANPFEGFAPLPRQGWGGYFVGSAAIALDHAHRFWLGATPRWFLANPAHARDRWFQISGEFSVRFR